MLLPAPAAEHAVVADAGLHVVRAHVGPQARARSCAASVWPIAQMSSRSPSTVSSAVRRIARGSTWRPRNVSSPRASAYPGTPGARSRGRTRPTGRPPPSTPRRSRGSPRPARRRRCDQVAIVLAEAFDVAFAVHAHERAELHEARIDAAAGAAGSAAARRRSGCCSNHSIGLLVASLLTAVGLIRQSIGPGHQGQAGRHAPGGRPRPSARRRRARRRTAGRPRPGARPGRARAGTRSCARCIRRGRTGRRRAARRARCASR